MTPTLDPFHRTFRDRLAPDGVPIRENFARWFAGSLMVEPDGSPTVLLHGTSRNFDAIKVAARGTFGSGIYCTTDPVCASVYAGVATGAQVMPMYMALTAPYTHLIQEPEWIDSWGEGLVKEVFNKVEAERIIRAAAVSTGDFGHDLTDHLVRLGYDGIVARYKDGSAEVVAFRPWQVKSAIGNSGLFDVHSDSLLDRADHRGDGYQCNQFGELDRERALERTRGQTKDSAEAGRPGSAGSGSTLHRRDEIVLDFGHGELSHIDLGLSHGAVEPAAVGSDRINLFDLDDQSGAPALRPAHQRFT